MLSSVRALTLLLVVAGAALRGASSSLTIYIKTEIIQVCEFGHPHNQYVPIQYTITEPEREWVAQKCIKYCEVTPQQLSPQQEGCLRSCVREGHRFVLNEKIREAKKEAILVAYRKIQKLEIISVQNGPDDVESIAHEPKIKSMYIAEKRCQNQNHSHEAACIAAEYTQRRRQVEEEAERQLEASEQPGPQAAS